jgi:hypothetical protein
MAKKEYFIIVDTETTITDKVFDFGAVVVDRHGNIVTKCAVIIQESASDELFYDNNNALWSKQNANKKRNMYADMVTSGSRLVASVAAVNRWLDKVIAKYNPTLTAYNIAFDNVKCKNTGIDLSGFKSQFCLWHLSCELFAKKKAYKAFALENHYFGNRTAKGNMTIKTNAEVMAHFVTGNYSEEPHTAIEDSQYFELPILIACLKKRDWKKNCGKAYSWNDYILKNHYKA